MQMDNSAVTIRIYNRKLEQVLYYLGFDWLDCGKEYGQTYWIFPRTENVMDIIEMFTDSYNKRREVC